MADALAWLRHDNSDPVMDTKSEATKNLPLQGIRIVLNKAVVWANPMKPNGIMFDFTLSRIGRSGYAAGKGAERLPG